MTNICRALVCFLSISTGPASAAEILVAAASNLNGVCQELARQFEKASGIHIVHSFSSTGNLARQIENGGPFDVFASADTSHVSDLERKGFIVPASQAVYARGRLVLWTRPGTPVKINSLNELAEPRVRFIALAQPDSAPYGAAAVETLRKLGLWEKVRPKLVYAENIGMAKQYAASGNTEAAFTAYSLVIKDGGKALLVDEKMHRPIEQALGIVKRSKNPDAGRRYTQFLLSPAGVAILEAYGYLAPAR